MQLNTGCFEVWDARDCKRTAVLERNENGSRVVDASLSRDSKLLLLIDSNRYPHRDNRKKCYAEVWDLDSRKRLHKIDVGNVKGIGFDYSDMSVHWLTDEVALIQTNFRYNDRAPHEVTLSLFDAREGEFKRQLVSDAIGEVLTISKDKKHAFARNLYGVTISRRGIGIGGYGRTHSLAFVDLKTLTIIKRVSAAEVAGKDATFLSALWLDSGDKFAAVASDHSIYLGSVNSTGKLKRLGSHDDDILYCHLDETNGRLISCSDDKSLKVWDLESAKCLACHKLMAAPTHVIILDGGSLLVSTLDGELIKIEKQEPKAILKDDRMPIRRIERLYGPAEIIKIVYGNDSVSAFSLQERKIVGRLAPSKSRYVLEKCVVDKLVDRSHSVRRLADVLLQKE